MNRMSSILLVLLVSALTAAVPAPASASDSDSPTLWLVDDVTRRTYHAQLDGTVIESFPTPASAFSSVTIDPVDRLLWGVNGGSGSNPAANPGKLVKYDRSGQVIREIPAGTFGAVGGEGMAVTVGGDRSLWVVDDPSPAAADRVPTVYNVNPIDGTVIRSFPTSMFDPASRSPQDIAYDPFADTLWVVDNSSETVYNISTTGILLQSFRTTVGPFASNPVRNVQGISIETADVMWLTARDTGLVYRVSKDGNSIVSSFPMTRVDAAATDPTGVAFDNPTPVLNFQVVETFALFGLPGSRVKMDHVDDFTGIVGRVGLGPEAEQDFHEGLLTGDYVVDPRADDTNDNEVVISGTTTGADLSGVAASAEAVSRAAALFMPQQSYSEIKDETVITVTPGVNVVQAKKIELDGDTLTLAGHPASTVIFNITDKLKLKNGAAIALVGGLRPENLLFNIVGDGDSALESGGSLSGGILVPDGKFTVKDPGSMLLGSVFGGDELSIRDGGRVRQLSQALQPGVLDQHGGMAALALPGGKAKLKDAASTVRGDFELGPFAQQDFDEGRIEGRLILDPTADNSNDNSVVITGNVTTQTLSRVVADAVDGSTLNAKLAPTRTISEIKGSSTISAGSGLTVVATKKIELDNSEILTIQGTAGSRIVFNIEEKIELKDASSVVLSGGITPQDVIFNVRGDHDSKIESQAAGAGILLTPFGKAKINGASARWTGSMISGVEVVVEDGGLLVSG